MFVYINNKKVNFEEDKNKTLLQFLIDNEFDIKYNCDGNGACGACQIKLDEEHYNNIYVADEELDIIEKQINSTPTSRLSCQLYMTKELNEAKIDIL